MSRKQHQQLTREEGRRGSPEVFSGAAAFRGRFGASSAPVGKVAHVRLLSVLL